MENPYLQYFLVYEGYVDEEPFHHSLLTHFQARLGAEILEVNEWIAQEGLKAEQEAAAKAKETAPEDHDDDDPEGGQLVIHGLASVESGPRDLGAIIDTLYRPLVGTLEKPRTYRNQARKAFLNVSKQRQTVFFIIYKFKNYRL